VLTVILLGSAAYAMSSSGDQPAANQPAAPTESAARAGVVPESDPDLVTLERTGADGAFMVTVAGVRCGVKAVGSDELPQRAKGEFCLVYVTAENAGQEARLFDGGIQRAVDTRGRAYPVTDRATVFLNDQEPTLLEEIAPGATVRGVLPFDVPAGTRLSALILHESAGSRGARVSLS
jgi:hypothetical protein